MQIFDILYFKGLLIGAVSFLMIGVFHPIVISVEYYFGKKVWPVFLIFGIITAGISLFLNNDILSIILGVFAFGAFWSTFEIFQQEKRVKSGRAKKNPRRNYD